MKKTILLSVLAASIFSACHNTPASSLTAKFKVWGNCGMCKETIESSLKKDGIEKAEWNKKTKMIEVEYDNLKVTYESLHDAIASAGYDTELKKGNDSAYAELPECCQYERKK